MSAVAKRAAIESFRRDAAQRLAGGEAASRGRWTISLKGYELPPASPWSDADARKLHHLDLDDLDAEGLKNEAWRVRLALALGDFDQAPRWAEGWLRRRLQRCQALLKGAKP